MTVFLYLKLKIKKVIMLVLIGSLLSFVAIQFFDSAIYIGGNNLNQRIETIDLTYISWACDCANWATKEDLKKYADNIGDTLARQSIFIEPANQSLELPDTLGYSNDIIRFTGQFYQEKGFPKDYKSFEDPEKARVFRYTKYEVLKSNYKEYQPAFTKSN